jgi:hypothetical protein
MKLDEGGKRKLSKRKDPEAASVSYYREGISCDAVLEYFLNIMNSNFSDWRIQNPDNDISEFDLSWRNLIGLELYLI